MIQEQNKQQDNKPEIKAKEAVAASFVMPVIRTMADDLAEANNPNSIPVQTPISVSVSTPAAVVNTPIEKEKTSFDRTFRKVAAPPLKSPVVSNLNVAKTDKPEPKRNVVLDTNQPKVKGSGKAVGISIFVGVFVSLILCLVVWAGWMYWPRKTATIADKIPAETLAFISFHNGSIMSEKILPKVLEQFGVQKTSLNSQWSDLVYGILPGSTSSEAVPFLLLTGEGSIDPSGTEMKVKKMANDTSMIVNSSVVGRTDGLSGKTLSGSTEYKSLLAQLPGSVEYLYMKQGQLASVVKAFTYLSPSIDYPILISLSSGGENVLAVSGAKGVGKEWVKKQVTWDNLLKPIPAEILSSAGGTDLSKSFDEWRISQSNDPKMQEFLNGLNDQGSVLEKIRADLTGNYIAGGASSTNLLPDGVAVMEIKDGAVDDLKAQMTLMEAALTKLGSMIGGASYADVSFADNNYKDVPIRFVNFGDSSHSFDYAIADSMLLVSNSKNSMQRMIDVYKGEADSFAKVISAKGQIQANWQYVLFSPDVLAKLSAPLKTLLSGFASIYIEPTSAKTFSGSITF